MVGTQRRRSSRIAALTAVIFVVTNFGLIQLADAQETVPVNTSSPVRLTAPAGFVAAPSMPLGFVPAAMAGGDLTGSGHTDVVAADFASGEVVVYLSDGQGGFSAPVRYASIPNPDAVAIADLRGDGKPDVVVASGTAGMIAVLQGRGDGTLGAARSFATGFNVGYLAVGDFMGNGHLDVAAAGLATRAIAVLENDGEGNLAKPVLCPTAQLPTGIAVADFNSDGRADIAVAQADGSVSILFGEGGAHFRASAAILAVRGPISSIAGADFNRDGNIDLTLTAVDRNTVSVLLGKGDGTFAAPVSYAVGSAPVRVLVADTNADGIPDLIVVNRGSNTFSVLEGAGDGTFAPAKNFVAGNGPEGIAAGEFYGSGHADLAVMNTAAQTVSIPAGNGDGTFHAARSYTVGEQPVAVASGDLNGDGHPDLVVANYCGTDASCGTSGDAVVLLSEADGTYRIGSSYALGAGPVAITLIDVNGDKHPDLVAVNRFDRTLTVRLGLGDGTFGQPITSALAGAPKAVAAGNFNGIGKMDLAILEDCGSGSCTQPGNVEILRGAGDGNFQSNGLYPVGYAPVSLSVGSIDASGHEDIVVANRCGTSADCSAGGLATVLLGDGAGNFKAGTSFNLGRDPAFLALGDLTGSGVLDAVISRSSENSVAVFRGNGDGTFKNGVAYQAGQGPGAIAIADFTGDGKPDVALVNVGDSTVSLLAGNGDGTLQSAEPVTVGSGPTALAVISENTGGHPGLATANGNLGSAIPGKEVTVLASLMPETPLPAPTIDLTSTPPSPASPQPLNAAVTFTATLSGVTFTPPPTGPVEFQADGNTISGCSAQPLVTSDGGVQYVATCATSSLLATPAPHSIVAIFNPNGTDTNYATATSIAVSYTITALTPKIDLTTTPPSPASPQPLNTAVTFTARLSGVTFTPTAPTGTVAFQADGTTIAGCSAMTVTASGPNYLATCTTSSLQATPSPHSVVAIFNGTNTDTNYNTATSAPVSYKIAPATPTLSLTPTPGNSEPLNTSATFKAQLSGTFPAAVPPAGTVSFTINGNSSAACPSSTVSFNGSATCTTAALVAPSDKIQATYSNDPNYSVTGSATVSETITPVNPVVTISQPTTPPVVNQPVTLTAQVAATNAGTASPVAPTGKVTFSPNGTTCAYPVTLTGNPATAPCSYSFPTASSTGVKIIAAYSGDADYNSASATVFQVVSKASTTVQLTPTPTNPTVNQQVSFQAVVVPKPAGATVPTGTVIITDTTTGIQICKVTLSNGTLPACTNSTDPYTKSGTYNITAVYNGDTNFTAPTPPTTVPLTVGSGTTTVSLTASSSTWVVNQPVTFTATIAGGGSLANLAGSIAYNDTTSSTPTPLCASKTFSGQVVPTCNTAFSTAGSHSVMAVFTSSNNNFVSGNSNVLTQKVSQAQTTTTVQSATPSPSEVNQTVIYTVSVSTTPSIPTAPTGTVTVSAALGSQSITECTITLSATPSCSAALAQTGTYTITAAYSGDGNFVTSTSAGLTHKVGKGQISISIKPPTSAIVVNGPVTFSATITPNFTGTTAPSGYLAFTDSVANTQLCSSALLVAGTATCSVAFLAAGSHTITATYVGDTNFLGGSQTSTVMVQKAATKFALTPQPITAVASGSVMFSVKVTPTPTPTGATLPNNPALPTGTITFSSSNGYAQTTIQQTAEGCGTSGMVSLVRGDGTATATCNITFPHTATPPGTLTVSAAYSGDSNFSDSAGATSNVTVKDANISLTLTTGSPTGDLSQPATTLPDVDYVTQGFTNAADPLNPATITVKVSPEGGFSDRLNFTCTVTNIATKQPVTDPSCSLSSLSETGTITSTLTASTSAPVGKYSVSIEATDSNTSTFPTLKNLDSAINLFVIGTTGVVDLAPGASGTSQVVFNTAGAASGDSLTSFSCYAVTNSSGASPQNANDLKCAGSSTPVTGATTTVPITISYATTAASAQPQGTFYAAAIASPFLAILAWFGSRKSRRPGFFRFLGLFLVIVGIATLVGCGGSFNVPTLFTGTLAPGTYYVEVAAQDSQQNFYYTVIPVQIN